jgi:ABC-type bacteriocin/lantibiotic exporter with double-glycine peptidase domain
VRYQSRQATCGAVALLNALSSLQHEVTEDQVVAASGIKDLTQGLGTKELKRAATALGYANGEIYEAREPHGWLFLLDCLHRGEPCIMAVDRDEHWVAAVGTLGKLVLVADAAHKDIIVAYDRAGMMARWHSGGRKPFYAISLARGGK